MNPRLLRGDCSDGIHQTSLDEIPALDDTGRAKLLRDIKQWADFRQERRSQNRFAVQDDGIREEIDAEVSMQSS